MKMEMRLVAMATDAFMRPFFIMVSSQIVGILKSQWLLLLFSDDQENSWDFISTSRYCAHIRDATYHLGCKTEITASAKSIKCFCDSDLCNVEPQENDQLFSCYTGDLDIYSLDQAFNTDFKELYSPYSFHIAHCYTNTRAGPTEPGSTSLCFSYATYWKYDIFELKIHHLPLYNPKLGSFGLHT